MYLIPPFAVEVVDIHSSSRTGSYSDQGSMHGQTCSTYNTSRTWTNHRKVVHKAIVWVTFPRENKCAQTMKRCWIIKEGLCMWMAAPPLPSSFSSSSSSSPPWPDPRLDLSIINLVDLVHGPFLLTTSVCLSF